MSTYKSKQINTIKIAFLFVIFCNAFVDVFHKVLLQNIAFKTFDGSEQVVWISIINALIIIPFIVLFSFSGYLSDKYNKKTILIYGAVSSFVLSCLMVFSYLSSNFYLAMFNLVLLAIQSTIYSPAKFGIIIDIWGKKNLSKGNANLQSISIIAILFAIGFGSFVFENYYMSNSFEDLDTKEELLSAILPLTFYALPIAFLEMIVSIFILKKLHINHIEKQNTLSKNELLNGTAFKENFKTISSNQIIFLSIIGLSFFWAISQGMLAVYPAFLKEYLDIQNVFLINAILASSGIGIALGAYIYSKMSRHFIEVGTIPMASFAIVILIYLSTTIENTYLLALNFMLFGFFGGWFIVPLNSLIQFNTSKSKLGRVLAGNNWFQSIFMLTMLSITTLVSLYNLNPLNTIYLIMAIAVITMIFTVLKLPQSLILMFVKLTIGLKFKHEVYGIKNIPATKGALLLGNHVSWIDWAIIFMSCPRNISFVMHKPFYEKWYLKWLLKLFKTIPISNTSSKETIKQIAKSLDEGNLVVLFPEGGISRNGHLGEFKKGFELILRQTKTDVLVIPFYIRGLWETVFSRANKKYKNLNKNKFVSVSFGKAIKKESANTISVKKAIKNLSINSWVNYIEQLDTVPQLIFDRLKKEKSKIIFADSTGMELSGYKFLTASILFKNILKTKLNSKNIGILLPSTCAGAFINSSVLMLGKTAVNLNFTASKDTLDSSIKKAGIKSVITSKNFISKLKEKGIDFDEIFCNVEILFLEDLKTKISKLDGLKTLLSVITFPTFILKKLHIKQVNQDNTALIMFSSGSEGTPKGIELTHRNIVGNCKQISSIININDKDCIAGTLPFFHAFGTVVTLFYPLIEGIKCVCHPDPTDGYNIGKIIKKHQATIMLGTSTFLRLYVKNAKMQKEMLDSIRLVVAGAEKLSSKVRTEFKNKFDLEIYEGYGVTETTPVASCNLPNIKHEDGVQIGNKVGTVGMPIPGTKFKIVDLNTHKELAVNEEGMVLIGGVQVMKGYLKDKSKTNDVLIKLHGKTWYVTGDKGKVDEDGFLTIVDRYSRFAKLGGEMISLTLVEEKIKDLVKDELTDLVITSLPDEKKGEKIICLISNINEDELSNLKHDILTNFDSKLMVPSTYKIIDEIPKLGSGKSDFAKAKKIASQIK